MNTTSPQGVDGRIGVSRRVSAMQDDESFPEGFYPETNQDFFSKSGDGHHFQMDGRGARNRIPVSDPRQDEACEMDRLGRIH